MTLLRSRRSSEKVSLSGRRPKCIKETVSTKLSAVQLTAFCNYFSSLHIAKFHIVHAFSANHLYHGCANYPVLKRLVNFSAAY